MLLRKYILLMCLCVWLPGAWAADDTDFQFWNAYNWKFYKAETFNLNLYVENRVRDDASEAFGYFFGPTIRYKLNDHWGLGGAVKMIHFKSGDHFSKLQRTELEATYKLKMGPLKFDHRNRHEYFFRETGSDSQRLRSRLRFSLPLKGRLSKLSFSNEFFYDDRTDTFAINRLVPLSLSFKLSKRFSLDTNYVWEHRRSGSLENHILSVTLFF